MEPLTALQGFRERLHGAMRRRQDALFDLTDAILTADPVPSPVPLSLVPAAVAGSVATRRSLRGQIDEGDARELLARYPSAEDRPAVYPVDASPWPRCDAEASPGRGYLYHPSRHSAGQPIVQSFRER